jgi:hypothetical protein
MSQQLPGRVITFYSYKGGTGRSMALAHVAWILASSGKKVLAIDWDLEAPGLHRFFGAFLYDKELQFSEGVIDFVVNYSAAALTPAALAIAGPSRQAWLATYANLLQYASSLSGDHFPPPGTLDFVPAGKQDGSYPSRVNLFNWQHFYEGLSGHALLEEAKRQIQFEYDFILIDSRTGVSDTSGTCTMEFPDDLVACFVMNTQSIDGAANVATSAYVERSKRRGGSRLRIWPVAMRIDTTDPEKLGELRKRAIDRFDTLLTHLPEPQREQYWKAVAIPHDTHVAYGETLAPSLGGGAAGSTFVTAVRSLASYLVNGSPIHTAPSPSRGEAGQPRLGSGFALEPAAFLSYAHFDNRGDYVSRFRKLLSDEYRVQTGGEFVIFEDRNSLEWGVNWPKRIDESLNEVTFLIAVLTPNYFNSPNCRDELEKFLEREKRLGRDDLVLSLLLVETPGLGKSKEKTSDELVLAMSKRQLADWTQFRLTALTSVGMSKRIAELAGKVRQRLSSDRHGKG